MCCQGQNRLIKCKSTMCIVFLSYNCNIFPAIRPKIRSCAPLSAWCTCRRVSTSWRSSSWAPPWPSTPTTRGPSWRRDPWCSRIKTMTSLWWTCPSQSRLCDGWLAKCPAYISQINIFLKNLNLLAFFSKLSLSLRDLMWANVFIQMPKAALTSLAKLCVES